MEVKGEACRICGNFFANKTNFIGIFDGDYNRLNILEFIRSELHHWQLEIMANDGLPQRICGNCYARFSSIHAFRERCIETQRKLWQSLLERCNGGDNCLDGVGSSDRSSMHFQLDDNGLILLSSDDFLLPPDEAVESSDVVGINDEIGPAATQISETAISNNYSDIMFDKSLVNNNDDYDDDNIVFVGDGDDEFSTEFLMDADPTVEALPEVQIADVLHSVSPLPQPLSLPLPLPLPKPTPLNALYESVSTSRPNGVLATPMDMDEVIEMADFEEVLEGSIIPTIPQYRSIETTVADQVNTQVPNNNPNSLPATSYFSSSSSGDGGRQLHTPVSQSASTTASDNDYDLSELECDIEDLLTDPPLSCPYCNCVAHQPEAGTEVQFPSAEELSRHFFEVHDPKTPYLCLECHACFASEKARNRHVRDQHAANRSSEICVYCKKKLRSPMEVHQYTCAYVDDWECEACGKKFKNAPLHRFRIHQRHHDPTKQFRCATCARVFVRRANLEAHEREHAKQMTGSLIACDECNEMFINDYELKRHKYQLHKGEPPVRCEHCNKNFVSNAFFNRHMQNFHSTDVGGKSMTCSNCDTVFTSVNKLRNHMQRRRDHDGKCRTETGAKEPRPRPQRQRRVLKHQCPHCARRFSLASQLKQHLLTHDDQQRPVQCEQCHVRCRNASELEEHVNAAHAQVAVQRQQPSFSCNTCGKCFAHKKNLLTHAACHNRSAAEKYYDCKTVGCDFVGANEIALSTHVSEQHVLVPCKHCNKSFLGGKLKAHMTSAHGHLLKSTPTTLSPVVLFKNQSLLGSASNARTLTARLTNGVSNHQPQQQMEHDDAGHNVDVAVDETANYQQAIAAQATNSVDVQMASYFIDGVVGFDAELVDEQEIIVA